MGNEVHVYIHGVPGLPAFTKDAEQPRATNGQFGSGGGSSQAHSSLGAGHGPGFNPGKAHKPEWKGTAAKTFPVGSKVRLPSSQEFHEVVGHSGAGANAVLALKSGGHMPANKALLQGDNPASSKASGPKKT